MIGPPPPSLDRAILPWGLCYLYQQPLFCLARYLRSCILLPSLQPWPDSATIVIWLCNCCAGKYVSYVSPSLLARWGLFSQRPRIFICDVGHEMCHSIYSCLAMNKYTQHKVLANKVNRRKANVNSSYPSPSLYRSRRRYRNVRYTAPAVVYVAPPAVAQTG